jgi:hypothetical protein
MSNSNLTNEVNVPKQKPWLVNLSFTLLELISIVCYLIFGFNAIIDNLLDFDIEGMFEDVFAAILVLTIVVFVYSTIFISVKKLRTSYVKFAVIWNFIWIGFNIYGLIG